MSKASEGEREIHQLILKSDGLALSKLYVLYDKQLTFRLKKRFPKTSLTLIQEALNEALFGYFKNPFTYDPDKSSLLAFLDLAARRDLLNILQKEKKHTKNKNLDNVELNEDYLEYITEDQSNKEGALIRKETVSVIEKELNLHFKDIVDVELAKMILGNERETAPFAIVLNIQELPQEEQQKIVKRHKDRIKKVIDRKNIEQQLKDLLK